MRPLSWWSDSEGFGNVGQFGRLALPRVEAGPVDWSWVSITGSCTGS